MKSTFPDIIQTYVFFFGVWEPYVTSYIKHNLKSGDIFIDIGANVGYYTLLASRAVGPNGQVISIEASPSIFRELSYNLDLNKAENILTFNIAVSDKKQELPIYKGDPYSLGNTTTITSSGLEKGFNLEAMVKAAPICDIISSSTVRSARIIKIDVEGAEWTVLQGFRNIISSCSENTEFIVEVNRASIEKLGGSIDELIILFKEHNFYPYEIKNIYTPRDYLFTQREYHPQPLKDIDFLQKDILFTKKRVNES